MFRRFCALRWIYRQKYEDLHRMGRGLQNWNLSQHCVRLVISKFNLCVRHVWIKCHSLSSEASDKPNPKTCFYSSASPHDWHVIFTQALCSPLSSTLLSPLCPDFAVDVVFFKPPSATSTYLLKNLRMNYVLCASCVWCKRLSVVQGGSHLFTNLFSLNSFTNECNVFFCKGSVSKKS